ncbi:hypothetical protein G3M48_006586 [Beauveria asiatica]|uniref:Secreted protein n=1 Tax=Beauveria asiatica TaxID=1069075 RepID=A0AAW0S4S2_9HYPO
MQQTVCSKFNVQVSQAAYLYHEPIAAAHMNPVLYSLSQYARHGIFSGLFSLAIDGFKPPASQAFKLTLNMEFDQGYQFSVLDTNMIGFAEIPKGAQGKCTSTFSFTGTGGRHVEYSMAMLGLYRGYFDLMSHPSSGSWSPCGGSTAILNMNTACTINPTHLPALIAVDHVSGKFRVKFGVQWRVCREQ